MKLIVAGSTGLIATEVIRQALSNSSVSTIVGLARRQTAVPENTGPDANAAKLKSVICDDFNNYPEVVKNELAEADACIWLIAVTPSRLRTMPFEEVQKICLDYTVTGFETMSKLRRLPGQKPLRFIYASGSNTVRDENKRPWILGDYSLMRGNTEKLVLDQGKDSNGTVESCVARMGLVDSPGRYGMMTKALQTVGRSMIGLPKIHLNEVAAALLDQAINGFDKETLMNEDLVRIGQRALAGHK